MFIFPDKMHFFNTEYDKDLHRVCIRCYTKSNSGVLAMLQSPVPNFMIPMIMPFVHIAAFCPEVSGSELI